MTPKERAEELAQLASKAIHLSYTTSKSLNALQEIQAAEDSKIILSTIPLIEYEDCVEALKRVWEEDECGWVISHSEIQCRKCNGVAALKSQIVHEDYCIQGFIDKALANLAAKLNEK